MLHGQLKGFYNFISLLNRVNKGDPELVGFVSYLFKVGVCVWKTLKCRVL